ncbi:MAG: pyridoxal-phosphate dependent enzyme [Flavobacteriaceae bacterium]|nr:pyridoxal-phosphate dependent enzyme [Flavobacteriaceae bacterium]
MKEFEVPICPIQPVWRYQDVVVDVLREDLNHPLIQGNKFRKLKYNLLEAKHQQKTSLLTFGGAYSNHILAVAAAGKAFGFSTHGFIRGDELASRPRNPTLRSAEQLGMKLEFVTREEYRAKGSASFIQKIKKNYPNAYILPEGGTNELAVKGCEEILDERTRDYDFICVAVGTGGTISGIIRKSEAHQKVLGFPALKDSEFLKNEIAKFSYRKNYEFVNAYHFGGYAKNSAELVKFVSDFYTETGILIEPVYTGKLFFGLRDLLQNSFFASKARILAVHTGGLQGVVGWNEKYGNLNNLIKR